MTTKHSGAGLEPEAVRATSPELGKLYQLEDRVGPAGLIHILEPLPWSHFQRMYLVELSEQGSAGGRHAHMQLEQVFVAVVGRIGLQVKTPEAEMSYLLEPMRNAVALGPGIWREFVALEGAATLLVLASNLYSEEDYIRDWADYCSWFHERWC